MNKDDKKYIQYKCTRNKEDDDKLDQLVLQYQKNPIDENFELIYNIYKQKFNSIAFYMQDEDIYQELSIALYNAVISFNKDHITKFNTYFWRCAKNYLGILKIHSQAKKRNSGQLIYLDQPIVNNEYSYLDLVEDYSIQNKLDDILLDLFLEQALCKVPELNRNIFIMYIHGYTLTDIQQILHVPIASVFLKIKKIKESVAFRKKIIEYLDITPKIQKKEKKQVFCSVENITRLINEKLSYGR